MFLFQIIHVCCVDSFAESYFLHTIVMLLGSCQDTVVVKVLLGIIVGSPFKWEHTMDGAEFLVAWFKAYNVEILR